MELHEHKDIAYIEFTATSAHQFDLYVPGSGAARSEPGPLLCFVHGGAWRAEDKSHHADLARALAKRTGCAVAVPNYRLTPNEPTPDTALLHPAHAEDTLAFLNFVHTWAGPNPDETKAYDPSRLVLIGHSCSAHMLSCIVRDSSGVTPTLTPSRALLTSIHAVVVSEGIYDLDLLLASFPDYRGWFVEAAFGPPPYERFDVTKYAEREGEREGGIVWFVLHSTGDTLVDLVQSKAIVAGLGASVTDILEGQEGRIKWDFGSLKEEHNDLLRGNTYVQLVGSFVDSL
ncbi:alpha/beta-hydrolase [Punctularia strigosozonata HHB-11173 SS5]|uniref:alpha/beta-hydrolase n=1 Tax=Punctularia strigosozonata (strain HHB-11173) TaxID=741275 RepID=UPI0004416C9F|nr:alpha/beta-hydrolase [Punctularia strigosozonata HHB-11173 SS5]EIN07467.1 alpha/beta-hydrolase [Punctularia strigosozonata HHB-11173 SS5]